MFYNNSKLLLNVLPPCDLQLNMESNAQHGVEPGDLIIAIDDLEIISHDHCMESLKGSTRPIDLGYLGMCFHSKWSGVDPKHSNAYYVILRIILFSNLGNRMAEDNW